MSRSMTSRSLLAALIYLFMVAPVWAAPVRTGSVSNFADFTNASSTSISVPADAEILLVGVTGYDVNSTANWFSSGSITIGGSALTCISGGNASTSAMMGALCYKVLPATGTQTLAWDWAGTGAASQGVNFMWSAYKGINTSGAVRDSDGAQQAANPHVSKTLTAQSGDLIVSWAWQFVSVESTFTWTGATEVLGASIAAETDGSWAETSPSGNQTVSASCSSSSDGGVAAIVLVSAGGGGGTTKTLTLMGVGQ